jgi:hypothetical protein
VIAAAAGAGARSSATASAASGIPAFTTLKGAAAPLDIQNVDTDMIIPKQFLKVPAPLGKWNVIREILTFQVMVYR